MKRRALNTLTALTLLLCVAVCLLWVRGRLAAGVWRYTVPGKFHCEARGSGDAVQVFWARNYQTHRTRLRRLVPENQPGAFALDAGRGSTYGPLVVGHSTRYEADRSDPGTPGAATGFPVRFVFVQWWLPAAVAAVLPAVRLAAFAGRRFRAARRRRRRRIGHCGRCGYDLTGNVSGTCPECGTPALANEATP